MRVLIVAPQPFYQERGTPIAVRMLLEALCFQGHSVDLVTYHEGSDLELKGLRILRIPALPGVRNIPTGISWQKLFCDVLLCWKLLWLALTRRYEVVHAVEEAVFPVALLRRLHRARIVYDMDSMLSDQLIANWRLLRPTARLLARLEGAAMRRADAVFAPCRDLAMQVRQKAPDVPVFVIEDVPFPWRKPSTSIVSLRDSLGISGALVLYVGNFDGSQGLEQLIECTALLPPERDVTLVLIGGSPAGVAGIRRLARQLGVERRIHLLGPRPLEDLAAYLAQADVLASPRLAGNNTPMKIYSYMSSGRPILATRIRAHLQVLDERCAHLVESNPQALAEGLLFLLDNADLGARLAAAAKSRVEKDHVIEAFRDKVWTAYQSLEHPQAHKKNTKPRSAAAEVRR